MARITVLEYLLFLGAKIRWTNISGKKFPLQKFLLS